VLLRVERGGGRDARAYLPAASFRSAPQPGRRCALAPQSKDTQAPMPTAWRTELGTSKRVRDEAAGGLSAPVEANRGTRSPPRSMQALPQSAPAASLLVERAPCVPYRRGVATAASVSFRIRLISPLRSRIAILTFSRPCVPNSLRTVSKTSARVMSAADN
jgi:hypothetical protein